MGRRPEGQASVSFFRPAVHGGGRSVNTRLIFKDHIYKTLTALVYCSLN